MRGVRDDLIVSLTGVDVDHMLEHWRWLLPTSYRPKFATALGDLFLVDADGRVTWLDVGRGTLEIVAEGEDAFESAATIADNLVDWFGKVLVDALRAAGNVLGPGECYSYRTLPLLGGRYEPQNFTKYPVARHFRVWGPIHEQLRDVPDGSGIRIEIVD